jgi:DNA-binding Lrp family transcriptional regulator
MLASRLLSILMLLQARGRMSASRLAAEFEVAVRTIHSDIDQLSAAGIFYTTFALRGYTASNEIVESTLPDLTDAIDTIRRLLAMPDVGSLHARFAGHGCFAARIMRE